MSQRLNAFTNEERTKLASLGHIAAGYFTTKVNTTVTMAGTYYKVNATFIPSITNGFVWNGTLNRWEYTATPDTVVSIFATFTGSHDDAVAAHDVSWAVFKNGTIVDTPPAGADIDKADQNSIALMAPAVSISTNDYIEIYVTMDSSGDDAGTENMNFLIR